MSAGFQHVRTIALPGPNPRPGVDGVWRLAARFDLSVDKFVGVHPARVGERNKVFDAHPDADGVAAGRIGEIKADHGFTADDGFGNGNFALGPDLNNGHAESPAEKPEPSR